MILKDELRELAEREARWAKWPHGDAGDLPPCPFCGAAVARYDGDTIHHPEGDCLLAGDLIDEACWSRRAIEATRPTAATDDVVKGLVEALQGIERVAEKHTGISGSRSLQTAMHAISHGARAALARTGVTLNG